MVYALKSNHIIPYITHSANQNMKLNLQFMKSLSDFKEIFRGEKRAIAELKF